MNTSTLLRAMVVVVATVNVMGCTVTAQQSRAEDAVNKAPDPAPYADPSGGGQADPARPAVERNQHRDPAGLGIQVRFERGARLDAGSPATERGIAPRPPAPPCISCPDR